MAKYQGPRTRVSRRLREPVFGISKSFEKKNYPPGIHGRGKKGKQSEYAIQLIEKQKAKYTYGLLEKQFRNVFYKASQKKGITGANLLILLESRLDNTVFRFGIAPSRRAARQFISHCHILVNDEVVNIPSYVLRAGERVSVREKSKSLEVVQDSLADNPCKSNWLNWNPDKLEGTFLAPPEREAIPENIKEQLIVELYSK